MYGLDEDLVEPDPPPTKSDRESMVAIAIALAIGTAAVSLFLIHYVASEIGVLIGLALIVGPAFAASYYLTKEMAGYHSWARFVVGLIIFLSVSTIVAMCLAARHFRP
jgi:hypothetical protein